MTSLCFCWWHQIFSDHPMFRGWDGLWARAPRAWEPGRGAVGELVTVESRKIGELRILYGFEPCLIFFVSTHKNMCKMHQNAGCSIWGSQFSRLLRTSHFGGHRRGCRPRNRPGFAPFVRQSRETASRWSQRLEWYGWEPEAGWPVTHTSGNQWKIESWIQGNYGENFIHVVLEKLFYLFWEVLSV